ncbi:MAG TPA: 50S ribosomal protein L24 [Candidatus Paceibacterota bacterium]
MNKLHVKKGDTVVVLSGNEKGKSGKIIEAYPKLNMVVVEGLNMRTKHQKPRKAGQAGQILKKQHPIHVSKVALKK